MLTLDPRQIQRLKRRDLAARCVITVGGVMIIASVIAILLLIVGVTLPLFMPARATLVAQLSGENFSALGKILTAGVRLDLDQRDRTKSLTTDFLSEDGVFAFFDLT